MPTHIQLAAAIGLAGFVFTSRAWLRWLHNFNPETGLVLKNLIILLFILGLHVIDKKVGFHSQALGLFLIYVAFTIVFDYQSEWIEDAEADNIERQTVDGVVYHRMKNTLGLNPDAARLITFVIVPFLLVLFGSWFVRDGQLIRFENT